MSWKLACTNANFSIRQSASHTASHTAKYIVEKLMECLKIYGIDIAQIIAMESDNASNMIAAAKQLDDRIRIECENGENEENIEDFNSPSDNAQILNDITEQQELETILTNDDNYEQLFKEVIGELTKHTNIVTTIRCEAHSIQLCVRAALKNSNFYQVLNLSKYVVKKLHTQKYKYEIHEAKIDCISPHPSNDTRWDSDLQMVRFNILKFSIIVINELIFILNFHSLKTF